MKYIIILFILIPFAYGDEYDMFLDIDELIIDIYKDDNIDLIKPDECEVDMKETIPDQPIVLPELSRATDCIIYNIIKNDDYGRIGFLNISEIMNISMNLSRMGGSNGSRDLFRLNKSTSFV